MTTDARLARLERSVFRLRLLVAATCLTSCITALAALYLLRDPTELRIGNMRLDRDGLSFKDGENELSLDATGIVLESRRNIAFFEPQQLLLAPRDDRSMTRPQVLLVVEGDRARVAIDGEAGGQAAMRVDGHTTSLELDGKPVRPSR